MARATSVRFSDELRDQLSRAAAREGVTLSELIERFVREGLAIAQHPGVVFKSGPAGRRAALAGGPDVWEVVAAVRRATGSEARRVRIAAGEFGLHERQVAMALDYGANHREEIERIIAENEQALEEAERIAGERDRLLA